MVITNLMTKNGVNIAKKEVNLARSLLKRSGLARLHALDGLLGLFSTY